MNRNEWNENVKNLAFLFFMVTCTFNESSIQKDNLVRGHFLCLGAHLGK